MSYAPPLAQYLQSQLPGMVAGSLQQPQQPAPFQVPGPQQPLPFEQMQTPGQTSPIGRAQSLAQNQQQSPLSAALNVSAASPGSGAAGAGGGGMSAAVPWLMAYQYLQQNAATPAATFGSGRAGFSSSESGL